MWRNFFWKNIVPFIFFLKKIIPDEISFTQRINKRYRCTVVRRGGSSVVLGGLESPLPYWITIVKRGDERERIERT